MESRYNKLKQTNCFADKDIPIQSKIWILNKWFKYQKNILLRRNSTVYIDK